MMQKRIAMENNRPPQNTILFQGQKNCDIFNNPISTKMKKRRRRRCKNQSKSRWGMITLTLLVNSALLLVETKTSSSSTCSFIHTFSITNKQPIHNHQFLPRKIKIANTPLYARSKSTSGGGAGKGNNNNDNAKKKKNSRRDASLAPPEQIQQHHHHHHDLHDHEHQQQQQQQQQDHDGNNNEEEIKRTATTSTSRSIKFDIERLAKNTIAARGVGQSSQSQQQHQDNDNDNLHLWKESHPYPNYNNPDNSNNDDTPWKPPSEEDHPYQNNHDFYRSGSNDVPPPPTPPPPRGVNSLRQLTAVIDDKLYGSGPRGAKAGNYPAIDGLVQGARDPMSSLLGYNYIKGDWREHVSDNPSDHSTYNAVIVFGKKLVRDQVTVEYASRIRALAKLFKENVDDGATFRPSLVCFTGPVRRGNHVSDADAGYIFFRHMCESQSIDLSGVDVFIDSQSKSEARAVQRISDEVRSRYIPKWLQLSSVFESRKDEYGLERSAPRKKVNLHFTLVSTEYHLCNMNDVHHRSPRQSALKSLEDLEDGLTIPSFSRRASRDEYSPWSPYSGSGYSVGGRDYGNAYGGSVGSYSDFEEEEENEVDHEDDAAYSSFSSGGWQQGEDVSSSFANKPPLTSSVRGIVETSWSFQYATYPYVYARDEAVSFLGRCYLLGEELFPLLVNMKGVVEKREFFQRDNYLMLASIRRSFVGHMEELHKPRRTLRNSLKKLSYHINKQRRETLGSDGNGGDERDVDVVLEGALLSLGRCVDLIRPAGLLVNSVSKTDWGKALQALEHSMRELREVCDPDRPLSPTEWGKLVEEDPPMLDIGREEQQHIHHRGRDETQTGGGETNYDDLSDNSYHDEFDLFRDE